MLRMGEKDLPPVSEFFPRPSSLFFAAVKSRYISRQHMLFNARAHVERASEVCLQTDDTRTPQRRDM